MGYHGETPLELFAGIKLRTLDSHYKSENKMQNDKSNQGIIDFNHSKVPNLEPITVRNNL